VRKFKFAAIIATVAVAVASLSLAVSSAQVTDISGHWSESYVRYGIEKGYINGYPDGTFLPDKAVTRAEFAKMTNSALGITKISGISFSDVGENEWFYPEVGKALYAGYVSGYEDGSFRASNLITRQEAAVILSRIATRPETIETTDNFADSKDIAAWAKPSLDFAYSKKFFTGDDLGRLNPGATLTRGQAAKILYSLVTTENVVNGDYTVTMNDAVCSETIFTDDVYFTATGDEPSLVLDGCTVLGTVYVRTVKDSTVKVDDSDVKGIICDAAYSAITLENGAQVKNVTVESPVALAGDGFKSVVLTGGGLSSETTEITANAEKVYVYSDAVIKADTLNELVVADSASLMLQSGTVKNMIVSSSAKDSVITLASGVYVEKLTVDAACTFKGAGRIGEAKNNVSGVSYTVKPEKVTGVPESAGNTDPEEDQEPETTKGFAPTTVSPKKNEAGVAVTELIGINFESAIFDANGKAVTESYIEQTVEIRKNTTGGTKVYFNAELTSSRKFELDPDGIFAGGTKYYVIIPAGTFKNADGEANEKISYYFITALGEDDGYDDEDDYGNTGSDTVSGSISVTPSSGKTDIDVDDEIKITFPSAICRQSGSAVTNSYLANTAIELREKSSSGERVSFTAEINSTKKVVTITPDSPLKPGTKYYIIVTSGSLEYSVNGTNIAKKTSYFTTSDDIGITVTPKSGVTGVALDSDIVIKFNSEIFLEDGSKIYDDDLLDIIQLKKGTATGKDIDFEASIDDDSMVVTVDPIDDFEAGEKYTVVIPAGVVANENDTLNKKFTSYFTAITEMQPMIIPADGEEEASLSDKIVIKFNQPVYKDKKGTPIDVEYVEDTLVEKNYITIYRENSTTNLANSSTITISDDYTTITFTPKKLLVSNRLYTVTFASGKVWNETGKKSNAKAVSSFSTAISGIPEFTPEHGTEDFAVDESIEIRFDDEFRTVEGNALTATYIQNKVITICKDNEDGEVVKYTAKLSNNNKTITVTPKSDLEGGTNYVIIISAETMLDSKGNLNSKHTSSFKTEIAVVKGSAMTAPEHKATGVGVDSEIVIEFNSPLYKTTGDLINSEYFKNNGISIITGTSTERKNDFDYEVSSDGMVVTITPKTVLDAKTKYTVKVLKGSVKYVDGSDITAATYYFTTGDGASAPVVSKFTVEDEDFSSASFSVKTSTDGTLYVVAEAGSDKVEESYELTANSEDTIVLNGLASNKEYTVSYYMEDADGNKSAEKTVSIKTTEAVSAEVSDADAESAVVNVSVLMNGKITVKYKAEGGTTKTAVSDKAVTADSDNEIVLEGLESEKSYTVTVVFVDENDGGSTLTATFETEPAPEEELVIETISFNNGMSWGSVMEDAFEEDFEDGVAELVTAVKLEKFEFYVKTNLGNSNDGDVTLEFTDSNITVKNGVATAPLKADGTGTINVTVVSKGGQEETFSISVSVWQE